MKNKYQMLENMLQLIFLELKSAFLTEKIKLEKPHSKKDVLNEMHFVFPCSHIHAHTQYLIVSFAGSSCEGNWGREMDKTSHFCVWYRAKLLGQPS